MNIQEIFNKVIEAGHYGNSSFDAMCSSLALALGKEINEDEYIFAIQEIRSYLGKYIYLKSLLVANSLPYTFEARLKIYKDWKNRPKLG